MSQLDVAGSFPKVGRYAAIDCGTNSVKLIVADLAVGSARPVFSLSETTRIGTGMQANGMRLQPGPMHATLEAIERFVHAAGENGALETVAIGTAALRDATNSAEFLAAVTERCGVEIEIIAGAEEARLSFLAVRRDPHWRASPRLMVIDIGGGSTELIQGEEDSDRIRSRTSVNVGAVKLTEATLHSDPPSEEEVQAAKAAARDAFTAANIARAGSSKFRVVGVGGTLTNLASMKLGTDAEPEAIHGSILYVWEIEALSKALAERSIAERRTMLGLDPRRADIILAGSILLKHALTHIGSEKVEVSTRGLRWGLLYDRFLPAGNLE